ncbi:MAG: 2-C-methyl-D-erythritol 2,4-cyclodiphosphate synthase [Bacilli bacterium]
MRIGHSYDIHRLVLDRPLILGGIHIDHPKGLLGHSDADVVYHVVAESIIGALGQGDLGTHFSDKDPQYHNKDSSYFVQEAVHMMKNAGYRIGNIDITVYLEIPILKDFKPQMCENISRLLEVTPSQVNLKATRGEGLGYIGRQEGIASEAVVLLVKKE